MTLVVNFKNVGNFLIFTAIAMESNLWSYKKKICKQKRRRPHLTFVKLKFKISRQFLWIKILAIFTTIKSLPIQSIKKVSLQFVLKWCIIVYRAKFATTQLLDLTVWVGLSAARTCMEFLVGHISQRLCLTARSHVGHLGEGNLNWSSWLAPVKTAASAGTPDVSRRFRFVF